MSWIGRLFGTEKTIDNIVDKDKGLLTQVGSWVGNMHYTEEERAEANAATRDWGLKQLEALAPFKVVQRVLAFSTCLFWIVVGLNVVGAIWVNAIWEVDVRQDMLAFALSDYVFWPVISVFSLYFTGGVFESYNKKEKEK